MKYQATLLLEDGATHYESTEFFAVDNPEAIEKAKTWIAAFGVVAEDARLQITLHGLGIRYLRPGEFK